MDTPKIDGRALIDHLAKQWQGKTCPMCGKGPWHVQNSAFELREFSGGDLLVGGPVIPVVPIVCASCGNTVLVNAIIAGLVKPEREVDEAKPAEVKP